MPDWLTGSVVLAAVITAFAALQNSERKINIEYVTGERAKWRNKIRKKALEVHQAAKTQDRRRLEELYLEFALLLNPLDEEDKKILSGIRKLLEEGPIEPILQTFVIRVAYLLKHDWERAKSETQPFWRRTRPPERVEVGEQPSQDQQPPTNKPQQHL
jgi:hypothetical protein